MSEEKARNQILLPITNGDFDQAGKLITKTIKGTWSGEKMVLITIEDKTEELNKLQEAAKGL